ncbi:MAG: CRISPR-associated endonuclease Cas2 [Alphaproteobacteria bacterium]|nr:CRISPR-associated endonuclease Cas2 [Alphaproteobacteria bacterium]
MLILVSYDVRTENPEGRRRLRKVSKICVAHGQRVQKSVFECQLTMMQLEEMERRLLQAIDEKEDNLRIYRLSESSNWNVKQYGCFRSLDFSGPLVV